MKARELTHILDQEGGMSSNGSTYLDRATPFSPETRALLKDWHVSSMSGSSRPTEVLPESDASARPE